MWIVAQGMYEMVNTDNISRMYVFDFGRIMCAVVGSKDVMEIALFQSYEEAERCFEKITDAIEDGVPMYWVEKEYPAPDPESEQIPDFQIGDVIQCDTFADLADKQKTLIQAGYTVEFIYDGTETPNLQITEKRREDGKAD